MIDTSLQHLETFLAVADLQSFTAAANKLNISKASVSQTIKLLEDKMQVPLFIRSTRNVKLSDEGKLLYDQCKRIQSEYNVAQSLICGFNEQPSGTLRISSNPYFTKSHLLDLIRTYQKTYPKVAIELITEERMPDMHSENIDIVFGVNWPSPDDVVAKKIGQTRYVFCASPDYLEQRGTPQTLKELEHHDYIAHSGRSPSNIIVGKPEHLTVRLNTSLSVNNALIMKKLAIAGGGIIQLHDYIVAKDIEQGRLVEVLNKTLKVEKPLYIYYQKHRYVQPKIRQFVKLCQKIN